jgi:hypothetical protein
MVAQSRGQSVFIPPSFQVHSAVPVAGELTLRGSFALFIHRSPVESNLHVILLVR